MRDITKELKSALQSGENWKHNIFHEVLFFLKKNNIIYSFWEREENWATILEEGKIVGYLWCKLPILFLDIRYKIDRSYLESMRVNIVDVNSFNNEFLFVNKLEIENLESFYFSNEFTVEDLWFQTNT